MVTRAKLQKIQGLPELNYRRFSGHRSYTTEDSGVTGAKLQKIHGLPELSYTKIQESQDPNLPRHRSYRRDRSQTTKCRIQSYMSARI